MALVSAFMHLYVIFKKKFIAFILPFFFLILSKKSGTLCIVKSREGYTIAVCPRSKCFFNRGNSEGTNSSEISCLRLVYVCCVCFFFFNDKFASGLILLILENLWFDDLGAE